MDRIIAEVFRLKNFLLFVLIQIIGFYFIYKNRNYHRVELVDNLKKTVYWLNDKYANARQFYNYKEQNEILLAENAKLKGYISALEDLDIRADEPFYSGTYTYMVARAIYNSYNRINNYLILNKGKKDGVSLDMAVISDKGIVGVVVVVDEHYSKVVTLFNMNFNLNVRLKKNFLYGSLSWELLTDDVAAMRDIPIRANVNVGDTIITDGKSFIFPEGINVGVVSYVLNKNTNQSFYDYIKVRLFEDFKDLGHVYLIKNLDKTKLDSLVENEK